MRSCTGVLVAVALGLSAGPAWAQDEAAAKLAAQKKAAVANWEAVEAGPASSLETKHLIIYAPKDMEKSLEGVGVLLEKCYDLARKALRFDANEEPVEGKVAVYLFDQREHFAAFVRRVERRRVMAGDTANYEARGSTPVVAGPARDKPDLGLAARAGGQLADLLLSVKAGSATPLPDWLVAGFARATYYRAAPADRAVVNERRQAARLARSRSARDIWAGTIESEEADALQGSLADFFAYGGGSARFVKLVEGYKLEENMQSKTTEQALDAAGVSWERVNKAWKSWALGAR